MFLANPDQLALLKQNNPRLADALLSGNISKYLRYISSTVKNIAKLKKYNNKKLD